MDQKLLSKDQKAKANTAYGSTTVKLPSYADSYQLDWTSLYVVYWVILVSEAGRGLVLPSQWPYLHSLGGSKTFLGILVASFSFGRMIATVPFGFLSDTFSMRVVLIVSSIAQIAGNLLYAVAWDKYSLLVARIIVGFGSATMSVCRAHVTRSVLKKERTSHFAYLSALQFVGFAVLPGAGGILSMLPEYKWSFLEFDQFTYPGWFLILGNLFAIFLLSAYYVDPPTSLPDSSSTSSASSASQGTGVVTGAGPGSGDSASVLETGLDVLALVSCIFINITFRGAVAQLETVSSPFLMNYGVSLEEASFRIGLIGFAGLLVYVSFGILASKFSDRNIIAVGLVILVLSTLVLGLPYISLNENWFTLFLGFMWALAYPLGQTAVLGLFSKKIAGLPAGGFLGLFSMSGSLSRLFFAMLAGFCWNNFGEFAVFQSIIIYSGCCLVFFIVVYERLAVIY